MATIPYFRPVIAFVVFSGRSETVAHLLRACPVVVLFWITLRDCRQSKVFVVGHQRAHVVAETAGARSARRGELLESLEKSGHGAEDNSAIVRAYD
jgi:hypothetical protein